MILHKFRKSTSFKIKGFNVGKKLFKWYTFIALIDSCQHSFNIKDSIYIHKGLENFNPHL